MQTMMVRDAVYVWHIPLQQFHQSFQHFTLFLFRLNYFVFKLHVVCRGGATPS